MEKVDQCIQEMEATSAGVFVRMSSRSPKDSGFGSTRMQHILPVELQIARNSVAGDLDGMLLLLATLLFCSSFVLLCDVCVCVRVCMCVRVRVYVFCGCCLLFPYVNSISEQAIQNAEWVGFFESQIRSLRVLNGSDALKLLLHSERVNGGIYTRIECAPTRCF